MLAQRNSKNAAAAQEDTATIANLVQDEFERVCGFHRLNREVARQFPDYGEMLDWVLVLDDAAQNYPIPGTRQTLSRTARSLRP